jgi:thymidylate synthase (FAD)
LRLPKVYLIGKTEIDFSVLKAYLEDTGNEEFLLSIEQAKLDGCSNFEILCSFYAKLCYKSLRLGENKNVTKIRDIKNNFQSVIDSGHGSVLEHVNFNFVLTDVSRVFTHELCRHRVGTAFSQTSGRYVRGDDLELVVDPILTPAINIIENAVDKIRESYLDACQALKIDEVKDFGTKKKMTSALRRILPNGQTNEIGFSVNLRSLRHILLLRTNRHAEWEIRYVFDQVYKIFRQKYQNLLYGLKDELVEGLVEVTNDTKN